MIFSNNYNTDLDFCFKLAFVAKESKQYKDENYKHIILI